MPTLSTTRQAYLDAEDYTDAFCIRIVKADGTESYYTSYHTDLTMSQKWDLSTSPASTVGLSPSHVYKSNSGYGATAVASSATLSIDNIDIMGIYDATGITKADLDAGVYDGAEIYIFLTDFNNPIEDEHPIKKAVFGTTTLLDETYHIEFRGLTQLLQQEVGRKITILSNEALTGEGVPLTASTWAASTAYTGVRETSDWRDATVVKPTTPNGYWYYLSTMGSPNTSGGTEPTWPTTVDGTVADGALIWTCFQAYAYDATVTTVTDNGSFTASGLSGFPDDWFTYGTVTWNTGNNANKSMEVKNFVNGSPQTYRVDLFLNMPFTIQVGDTFTITVGYDRTFAQNKDKFDNVMNFEGFPHLPGPRTAGKFGGQ